VVKKALEALIRSRDFYLKEIRKFSKALSLDGAWRKRYMLTFLLGWKDS